MNVGERKLMEYQRGQTGGFYTKLFDAMFVADVWNRNLLRRAYFEEMEAVCKWVNYPDYANRLEEEYESGKESSEEGSGKGELEDPEA